MPRIHDGLVNGEVARRAARHKEDEEVPAARRRRAAARRAAPAARAASSSDVAGSDECGVERSESLSETERSRE